MGDLISRAELFNRLATVQTLADAYAVIQGMPTVDAVPVVRCRNCCFSQRINEWVYECYVLNVDRMFNQYCDMGERKDGDEHG